MQHKSWEMGLFKKKIDNVISVKFWMTKERRGSNKKNTWKGWVQMGIQSSVFMYTWPICLSACELPFIGFAWLCDKLVQILVTVTVYLSLWVATLEEKNCIPNHILKTVDHSQEEIMIFGLCRAPLPFNTTPKQTWNLSKILHCQIFRIKNLHRKFHLILTVLVRKKTQKMSENGEFYTAGQKFSLLPAVTALTNLTSVKSS